MTAAVPDPRFRDQLAEELGRHQGLRGPMDDERPDVWQNRCDCGWDDGDERPGWRERYRQHIADALLLIVAARVQAAAHEWKCPSCGATTRARMAAHVEARVQAAASQRAAEELLAAAQWLNADPDKGGAPYITNDHTMLFPDKLEIAQVLSWACASLRDRAADLASPAPAPRGEEGQR